MTVSEKCSLCKIPSDHLMVLGTNLSQICYDKHGLNPQLLIFPFIIKKYISILQNGNNNFDLWLVA